jgi:hypothetical protein
MFFSYNESASARNHPANRVNLRIETHGKALDSRWMDGSSSSLLKMRA